MLILLPLIGCGPGLHCYPVQGQVSLQDGSPLPGGMVEFRSDDAAQVVVNPRGMIQ
jgi:hypothetical protein